MIKIISFLDKFQKDLKERVRGQERPGGAGIDTWSFVDVHWYGIYKFRSSEGISRLRRFLKGDARIRGGKEGWR